MKVVTFGELMVRLQPYNYERFVQASTLEFTFGGGEANVAVSLANYGADAIFVTKLPAHAIGQCAINSLRRYGVDTTKIVRGGDRVGIYYNEKGASQRGSVCIYDRAHSAIQEASTADFDWDAIFEGVDWFHFTGITPALGPNVVDICREACKAAKAHGVKISCDLNYRGKLWTREEARAAMTDLCQYVDVCISNEEDAKDVFGIEAEATDIYAGEINREGYKSVAKQLADKFGFEKVAITLRESHSASDNGWSAMLYDVASNEYCFSKKYELRIIDRVGGGDSFGGGLIYALLSGKSTQDAVEFAVAGLGAQALDRRRLQHGHRLRGREARRRRRLRPYPAVIFHTSLCNPASPRSFGRGLLGGEGKNRTSVGAGIARPRTRRRGGCARFGHGQHPTP